MNIKSTISCYIQLDSEVVGAFIKLTETLIQQKLEIWDDVLEKSNARMGE